MNEKLAIVVPTFNRKDKLLEALGVLIPEVKPFSIPIYVSDDFSSDGTYEAVITFAKASYEFLFIETVSTHLGQAGNVKNAVSMSRSDYVWLMPDDDRIVTGMIGTIMTHLSHGYGALLLNSSQFNRDFSRLLLERSLYFHSDIIFSAGLHEQVLLSVPPCYLGGVIVKRSLRSKIL